MSDTLFKRLFLLMWAALVASHFVAHWLLAQWLPPPPGHGFGVGPPDFGPATFGPGGPGGPVLHVSGPPIPMMLFEYAVRILVIGVAAAWGARWLAAPMRRLVDASQALSSSVGGNGSLPTLDEGRGTVEVREAAQVFNHMARRLDTQFKGRGLLIAAMSHDLRTPLTRIRMRLESLLHEPAAARCIDDVHEMNELIDSSLEVFRGDGAGEPLRTTDVHALVQALTDNLVEQGHPVTIRGVPAIAQVQPAALRRALCNLLSNAVRYGERATATVSRDDDGVRIVVEDEGPGIPHALMQAVFEPFYRVESSRNRATGGTGLGLYIARDLVQRQQGRLELANRPEGGLRATVLLPHRH